ncbi:MAG TPA: universal stress protein, partial [Gemmatimonadota bacterium]|nr:universal stress protein [Gemmatimonadota bacterium]
MWLLKLESVVAATDLKEASRSALSTAARLAALASAALHVVFVEEAPTRDAEARVREELEVAAPGAGEPASVVVMSGDAARAIVNRAVQVEADAIVLGPHARAVHQPGKMGGTAAAVVRSASCPCLVAARDLHLPLRNVLAPVDRSEAAEGTLSVALSWTSALRPRGGTARLTAFHASPAGPEREAAS